MFPAWNCRQWREILKPCCWWEGSWSWIKHSRLSCFIRSKKFSMCFMQLLVLLVKYCQSKNIFFSTFRPDLFTFTFIQIKLKRHLNQLVWSKGEKWIWHYLTLWRTFFDGNTVKWLMLLLKSKFSVMLKQIGFTRSICRFSIRLFFQRLKLK